MARWRHADQFGTSEGGLVRRVDLSPIAHYLRLIPEHLRHDRIRERTTIT
jgi:hypothetical protein